MSPISSSTLFHFTDSADNLFNILANDFRPHYSLEDLSLLSTKQPPVREFKMAFPMVSFCDIPLSQAANHMETYGHYSLGLAKSWGMQRGLTPVLYTHPNVVTSRALLAIGRFAKKQQKTAGHEIMTHLSAVLLLSKPYDGSLSRRNRAPKQVCFYDEREWRFIPPTLEGVPILWPDGYLNERTRGKANAKVAQYVLSFTPADIKYVIVPTESDLLPTIRELEHIKERYLPDDLKVLTSRVISAEQIRADF